MVSTGVFTAGASTRGGTFVTELTTSLCLQTRFQLDLSLSLLVRGTRLQICISLVLRPLCLSVSVSLLCFRCSKPVSLVVQVSLLSFRIVYIVCLHCGFYCLPYSVFSLSFLLCGSYLSTSMHKVYIYLYCFNFRIYYVFISSSVLFTVSSVPFLSLSLSPTQ